MTNLYNAPTHLGNTVNYAIAAVKNNYGGVVPNSFIMEGPKYGGLSGGSDVVSPSQGVQQGVATIKVVIFARRNLLNLAEISGNC